MSKNKCHKRIIQSITESLIYHILKELPETKLDFLYSTKRLVSRYVSFEMPSGGIYRIRISDHENEKYKKTYNYNLVIDCDKEFDTKKKACELAIIMQEWEYKNGGE